MSDVGGVSGGARGADVRRLTFDDNALLPSLYGQHDRHLVRIEQLVGVQLSSRGNQIAISGGAGETALARAALLALYERLKRGQVVDQAEVDAAVRFARVGADTNVVDATAIRTRKRLIQPRSPTQREYVEAIRERDLVFGLGPAGTGKTYLAVAMAVSMLIAGTVERIILSRPAVEAGERLGFLPGDMRDKVDPYLRPLYDALHDMMPADQIENRLAGGEIEVAPLAFMRGRTLAHAFVILDEAQNTSAMQMKMFLTRLGEGARMVVTGDLTQVDLPAGMLSGLRDAIETLNGVEGVRFVHFTDRDVVRHDLVARIVRAYDARDSREAPRKPRP